MTRTRFANPEHVTLLTSPSWSACEGLIKAFEGAWRRGMSPAIADYLRADGLQRKALLIELVHVDLEFRLKAGQPARVENYLSEYPELGEDRDLTIELLSAEFELRRSRDIAVSFDEYRARFPDLIDDLLNHLSAQLAATVDFRRKGAGRVVPPPRPDVPGYDLIEEVGRGGMGVVYKARDPRLDRLVALKFLPHEYSRDPDRLARFLREARTASALNHPHICTVHALGEHEGRPFLVMEFIEGQTLAELAERRPGLDEVARLLGQAAQALAAAHAAGVVHRDVKPENVMARGDGYVKVLDFGLARRLPTLAAPAVDLDTDPGAFMGTAAYMSPEQTRGEAADSASDIFSLGIVLYELAARRHPFDGDTALGMMHAIATRQPPPPSRVNPELPAALDGLVEAMLNKDARLRPTAAEVVAALAALGGGQRPRPAPAPARQIVHREPELAGLRAAFASAEAGRGGFVCVAGEPGIGKTTVVEAFLDGLAIPGGPPCLVARGRCSERLGGAEAYLPVIDALADLLRGDGGPSAARLMKVAAPTWYAQVAPAAADPTAPARAFTRQAVLLEFSSFLEEASRMGPVVLFLDDVHWADVSTVDLLAHLGARCRSLRVLVIVTFRPTEMLLGPHPFHPVKLELLGKGACSEWTLGFFGRQDVERYLSLAFPGHGFPAEFAGLIHDRTEGSPLFMADLLRYLRDRGVIAEVEGRWSLTREVPDWRRDLPLSVRSMIQRKLERLGEDDRRLLAAASVQGHEFDAAVVAAALKLDPADAEDRLQALDRVHRLVRLVREYELPDRTLTQRYAFVHALYQQALYSELPPGRRSSLSAAVARAIEGHHRDGDPAVAAELGCLYEVARDFGRAGRQFGLAALNAGRVSAHREAVGLARRGLRLLDTLDESPERASLEFPLQVTLGLQLQVTQGYAAPEARDAYTRARQLRPDGATTASLFQVLWGLWLYHKVRSELPRAWEMAGELQELARRANEPDLSLQAYQALGITALCRGDFLTSLRHVEQATAIYDPRRHRTHASIFGQDPGVICTAFGAVTLWLLGYPAQAARQSERAVQMSREQSPSSQAVANHFAAMLCQLLGDRRQAREYAEATAAVSAEHGFSFWLAGSAVLGGWARGGDDGLAELRRGLDDWAATGSVTYRTWYLGLLAEALAARGQAAEAQRVLDEALALAERTDERLYEAELHRLRGEALLSAGEPGSEEAFVRALAVARRQEAKSLALRAAISLARRCGRRDALAEALAAFTEGFDTTDLIEARGLLDGERGA
jgi:predicted ATPase